MFNQPPTTPPALPPSQLPVPIKACAQPPPGQPPAPARCSATPPPPHSSRQTGCPCRTPARRAPSPPPPGHPSAPWTAPVRKGLGGARLGGVEGLCVGRGGGPLTKCRRGVGGGARPCPTRHHLATTSPPPTHLTPSQPRPPSPARRACLIFLNPSMMPAHFSRSLARSSEWMISRSAGGGICAEYHRDVAGLCASQGPWRTARRG